MKKFIFALCMAVFGFAAKAQTPVAQQTSAQQAVLNNKVVEIACGECQFKMKGKSCDLAIRVDGVSYFVDGKKIADFGDAHAEHGFCNAISKAEVTGEIVNNRFKATNIKLLTAKKKK